jgi:K+-sensing histidine kinase KdpD
MGAKNVTDFESNLQSNSAQATDTDLLASAWMRYLASIAMTAIATAVAIIVDRQVTIPNLSLVFVVPVIIAGVGLGLGPSLCSALVGATAYNFFLTEPRYSLTVDDPSNIWAIALLFVVGLITSGVAFTSGRRAIEAARLQRQLALLQSYSRDVLAADNVDTILSMTCKTLAMIFQAPAVVMIIRQGSVVSVERTGNLAPTKEELEAALLCLEHGSVVRSGVYPNLTSRFDYWPAQGCERQSAVVGVAFDRDERPLRPDAPVDIVASVLALVLDRGRDKHTPH